MVRRGPSPTYAGAATQILTAAGSRPAAAAASRTDSMVQRGDVGVAELQDEAVADLAGQRERLRAVGGDPDLEPARRAHGKRSGAR